MAYTLNVNGKTVSVDVPADTPLLWVLRDSLHLYGTKYGCGVGQCGACTVHIRGRVARACQIPVQNAVNGPIVTIEGLSADGTHPVQKAWEELDVPQCGYCQAGQIMSAAALLASNPKPTDADIDTAMNGNICRCGTYTRIREGIHRAAGQTKSGDEAAVPATPAVAPPPPADVPAPSADVPATWADVPATSTDVAADLQVRR